MAENTGEASQNKKLQNVTLWSFVQAICTVLFVFFILLKFYSSTFTVDFSTLLSIVLAIFSIWLSATFYFKATETSNRFYENTYSHSKDIATLLVKIESGFGEKLENLRDNYSSIDSRMNGYVKNPIEGERESIESEMSEATEENEKLKLSKNEIINELILKANLAENEKEEFKLKLKETEANLKKSNKKINFLEKNLSRLDGNNEKNNFSELNSESRRVERYFKRQVKQDILAFNNNRDLADISYEQIQSSLYKLIENGMMPDVFLTDSIRNGYMDENYHLTTKGFSTLVSENNI
ncbi:hypothetical protein [Proteus terrae]|uniref:hypothetical protein n=1 Tax=Proteus terrae TaxID=1574161 RepID=UPI003075E0A1